MKHSSIAEPRSSDALDGGEDWLLGLMEPRVVISLFRQRGGNKWKQCPTGCLVLSFCPVRMPCIDCSGNFLTKFNFKIEN